MQAVLDTLIPKDLEVQTSSDNWYTMRIQPYRTQTNVIEGAVLTFVEITEAVRAREALKLLNDNARLVAIVRDSYDAITMMDLDGRILAWNPGAVRIYGWTEAEALAMNIRNRIPDAVTADVLARMRQLSRGESIPPYLLTLNTKGGEMLEVSISTSSLSDTNGVVYGIATTERPLPSNSAEAQSGAV